MEDQHLEERSRPLPGRLALSVFPLSPDGRRYASGPAFGLVIFASSSICTLERQKPQTRHMGLLWHRGKIWSFYIGRRWRKLESFGRARDIGSAQVPSASRIFQGRGKPPIVGGCICLAADTVAHCRLSPHSHPSLRGALWAVPDLHLILEPLQLAGRLFVVPIDAAHAGRFVPRLELCIESPLGLRSVEVLDLSSHSFHLPSIRGCLPRGPGFSEPLLPLGVSLPLGLPLGCGLLGVLDTSLGLVLARRLDRAGGSIGCLLEECIPAGQSFAVISPFRARSART